jgi:hypothetical protein
MKAGGDYADQWTIVRLPAIAEEPDEPNDWAMDPLGREPGDALWPEWYPVPALARIQRNTAFPRYWSSLFQQSPIPGEGDMFTVSEIGKRDHTNEPVHVRRQDRAHKGRQVRCWACGEGARQASRGGQK